MPEIRFAELTSYENYSLKHYVNAEAVCYIYQADAKGPTTIVMQGSVKLKVVESSKAVVEILKGAR